MPGIVRSVPGPSCAPYGFVVPRPRGRTENPPRRPERRRRRRPAVRRNHEPMVGHRVRSWLYGRRKHPCYCRHARFPPPRLNPGRGRTVCLRGANDLFLTVSKRVTKTLHTGGRRAPRGGSFACFGAEHTRHLASMPTTGLGASLHLLSYFTLRRTRFCSAGTFAKIRYISRKRFRTRVRKG